MTRALLGRLGVLARSLDDDAGICPAKIDEMLLFTFLAAVVTPRTTIVFGVGDGLVVDDARSTLLDPGPENAPRYVAYGLFDTAHAASAPTIHRVAATEGIALVGVATDGFEPIAAALPTLAADPRYLANPSLLRKRLVVLSDAGTFTDDATLGIVRRRAS